MQPKRYDMAFQIWHYSQKESMFHVVWNPPPEMNYQIVGHQYLEREKKFHQLEKQWSSVHLNSKTASNTKNMFFLD
jgi:hypothetical protein